MLSLLCLDLKYHLSSCITIQYMQACSWNFWSLKCLYLNMKLETGLHVTHYGATCMIAQLDWDLTWRPWAMDLNHTEDSHRFLLCCITIWWTLLLWSPSSSFFLCFKNVCECVWACFVHCQFSLRILRFVCYIDSCNKLTDLCFVFFFYILQVLQ